MIYFSHLAAAVSVQTPKTSFVAMGRMEWGWGGTVVRVFVRK